MRRILPVLAWAAMTMTVAAQGQATPSAPDLAQRIQAHYDSVRDFEADFTLSSRSAYSAKPLPEQRGQIQLKKPGRVFLEYTTSKDRYWADNVQFYSYDAAVKTGSVATLPKDDSSTPILFLMNRVNLLRDFTADVPADRPPQEWRLALTPKKPDAQVKTMTLAVDRATLKLTSVVTVDSQNYTNTFAFQNMKENVGLPDSLFANLKFPDGTSIIK